MQIYWLRGKACDHMGESADADAELSCSLRGSQLVARKVTCGQTKWEYHPDVACRGCGRLIFVRHSTRSEVANVLSMSILRHSRNVSEQHQETSNGLKKPRRS